MHLKKKCDVATPRAATNLDLGPRESSRDSTIVNRSILEIWTCLQSLNRRALARSKFQVCGRAWYQRGMSVAVLPALGIGDALLMMIASHQLKKEGCKVTTFHRFLPELSPWFPGHDLQLQPPEEKWIESLAPYDLILAENDNSPKIKRLIENYRPHLSIFYPTYLATKHAPISPLDKIFDSDLPMTENIASAIAALLDLPTPSNENGLTPPPTLTPRLNKEQVLIHPMSSSPAKNWKAEGFVELAHRLRSNSWKPLFCVGPSEQSQWSFVEKQGFALGRAPSLACLASLVYESGFVIGNDSLIGHLASNLGIPTLIIANDEKRMRLWRPGWLKGQLVLPPPYMPNGKFLRLRERHWQRFISPKKVLRSFGKLSLPQDPG
jgi:heptosyltransferase-3